MSHNERLHAFKILTQVLGHHSSLSQELSATNLATPMTKELCFGVCRHYIRLTMLADLLVAKRPKAEEVWVLLLMGLYQLQYMKLPDYAVVKETVALLEKIKKTWAKGLVNAVLRTFCRKQHELVASLVNDPQFIYGHPSSLLERLKRAWPMDWQKIALANDDHPPMTLRVNAQSISVSDYLAALTHVGIQAEQHTEVATAITLLTPCDVRTLPGFDEGWISVQDAAAQIAASLLDLKPGLRVLDACCAPGGKTCHILETESCLAECVALDVDEKRLKRVEENLKRQKLTALVRQGDALQPQQWWDGHLFDRILLDAPCSAIGVIRRHADIKLLRTEREIAAIIQIQHQMLRSLWPLLAPNGIMVYATCSIIPEENEKQMVTFIAEHPDCQVLPMNQEWGRHTGHGRQILPGEQGMDGFFYSVLVKGK
jgi:16S rRNA (cytosine967-C5)-methyltransferase